jgi:AcrR family transcriptional regulator
MNQPEPESNSRVRLLEAAILCFAEKGFDATGIREIAQKAKANSALVQYHFGGKTGLYQEALKYIFNRRPIQVPSPPASADEPEARPRAIQALHDMVAGLLSELLACSDGSELDQAAHLLVTREMQSPREDVTNLILNHMAPYNNHMQGCIKILRPDLSWLDALEYSNSVFGQILHIHINLRMIRLLRKDPEYPRDLQALARHITEFSLRGLAIPEAFPGACE